MSGLSYQPAGTGQLRRLCMINLARYPDPRAVLEAALGPLALFEVLTGSEPAPRRPSDGDAARHTCSTLRRSSPGPVHSMQGEAIDVHHGGRG